MPFDVRFGAGRVRLVTLHQILELGDISETIMRSSCIGMIWTSAK